MILTMPFISVRQALKWPGKQMNADENLALAFLPTKPFLSAKQTERELFHFFASHSFKDEIRLVKLVIPE